MEIALNTAWLKAFNLNESLLVWQMTDNSLHVLSDLSCWVFLGIDQGMSYADLLQEHKASNLDLSLNREQLSNICTSLNPLFVAGEPIEKVYKEEFSHVFQKPINQQCLNQGCIFQLNHLSYQIITECDALLTGLVGNVVCLPHSTTTSVDCQIIVSSDKKECWRITCNGVVLAKDLKHQNLLPVLMDFIQVLNYQSREYLLAVHAATVVRNGHALIMPGSSGSGKSTLCASILQQGFRCYSDELAVLDQTGVVQPLELPVGIKSGSWSLLDSTWPELMSARIWQRPDGRQLKYLSLPVEPGVKYSPVTRQTLLFPNYNADLKTAVWQRLTPEACLSELTRSGYQLKTALNRDKIIKLISLSKHTPAYRVSYSDLSQVQPFIDDLFLEVLSA